MLRSVLDKLARKALKWSVQRLLTDKASREEFIRRVNNETWLSAQMSSGGHALRDLKPIGMEETISIMCVLRDSCTYIGKDSQTNPVDYYNKTWKG